MRGSMRFDDGWIGSPHGERFASRDVRRADVDPRREQARIVVVGQIDGGLGDDSLTNSSPAVTKSVAIELTI